MTLLSEKLPVIVATGFSLLILGCRKETFTYYQAYIKNATGHQIKIVPYFSGSTNSSKTVLLAAGDSFKVASGIDRGRVDHGGFTSEFFAGSDSIVVTFDNTYPITHYFNQPSAYSLRYYLYASPRNLGNYLNWQYSFEDASKYRRDAFYLFRFIEQDYLDAK